MQVRSKIKPDFKKCIEQYGWTTNIIIGITKILNEMYENIYIEEEKRYNININKETETMI